jgi:cytochrome d ubiquinol oxidase subunit II
MQVARPSNDRAARRLLVTGLGPFVLANEVLLIVGAGIMVGAFPYAEGELLRGFYPVVVALLICWVLRDVAIWFRRRRDEPEWERNWDNLFAFASVGFAACWGLLLGNAVQGVPAHDERVSALSMVDPFAAMCAVSIVLIFAAHGAAFAAARVKGDVSARSARAVRPLALLAAVSVLLTTAAAAIAGQVEGAITGSGGGAVALLGVGTLALAGAAVLRGVPAFLATAVGAAVPVLAVGVAIAPRLLAGVAGSVSLERLAVLALPVLALLMLAQAYLWWAFRHRVDERSAVFF